MTQDEFMAIYIECVEHVADKYYPKNDTAALGGAPSAGGRRGEFLRDAGVVFTGLSERLQENGTII